VILHSYLLCQLWQLYVAHTVKSNEWSCDHTPLKT
jgi:hypothetical protein